MSGPRRVTTEDTSDKELVVAFKSGDRSAYEAIYNRHQQRVRAVCYRILGNQSDVEEAVQETFLRSYRALGRFNGQYQLGAWLARIAANVSVDQLRARARQPATTPVDLTIDLESSEPLPEGRIEDQIQMSAALDDIQPLHARALVLRGLGGLSHEEMAERLDLSPKQVKSLLHRARNSFRRAWQDASGWALAPLALRSIVDRSRHSVAQQGVMAGAASPAFGTMLERVAVSVAAVAIVLGGAPQSNEHAGSPREARAPEEQVASGVRPARVTDSGATPDTHADHSGTTATPPEVKERVEVIVSELTGQLRQTRETARREGPRDEPGPTEPGSASTKVQKTVKEAEKTVEELPDLL
jgi:RNA polymerase sigma-70 factor (ECF subfamily)